MSENVQKNPYDEPFRNAIKKVWKEKQEKIHELTKQIEENYWIYDSDHGDKTVDEYFQAKGTLEWCEKEREKLKAEAAGLYMAMDICMDVVDELMEGEIGMTEIQMGVLEGLLDWTTEMAKENPDTTIWEMERDALKAAIKELEVKK